MTSDERLIGALRYAIGAVAPVGPAQFALPTPCRDWDLRALLLHACDSVEALAEGMRDGAVSLDCGAAGRPGDPVRTFTQRATELLGRCETGAGLPTGQPAAGTGRDVLIGGCPLAASLVSAIGAIEIAVHAWDVSQACGTCSPIPEPLAADLLLTATDLICADERAPQFELPRTAPATASASDRLTAFLGRRNRVTNHLLIG